MKRLRKPASVLLILAALAVILFSFINNGTEPYSSPLPEGAVYAGRGSYAAGVRTLTIDNETPLALMVWYPAASTSVQETIKYPYALKLGASFGGVGIASYFGEAVEEASLDSSGAPYPVVILSPGFSLGTTVYAWLAEHLASYGFVVISPEHRESLDPENELWRAAITRPQDVLSIFNYLDAQAQFGGALAGWIDPQVVAVAGHSYGGYTALAAAGARMDTTALEAHCQQAYAEEHPSAWLCDVLQPRMAEMAELAGLDSLPEGQWPASADPRVDAVISLAGDAFFFGSEGLAEIGVPTLAMGGTLDEDSPYLWSVSPTYEYTSGNPKVRIALTGAEHMIFTGPCQKNPWYLRFLSNEFCADQTWERPYAHALVKHFTTAFLLAELRGDPQAAAELNPESVDFSEIVYDASGY